MMEGTGSATGHLSVIFPDALCPTIDIQMYCALSDEGNAIER